MATTVTNGLDLTNQRIVNLGSPSADADAANKSYVDSIARGLHWKSAVRAASTGNVDLAAPGVSIDDVTLQVQDRILLKDQTAGEQNGIYVWTGASAALTRATDANTDALVTAGMAMSVTSGTVNGDKVFILTTDDPIVLDTTPLAFSQLGGGGAVYTAGAGLTGLTTFDVGQGEGIVVTADAVAVDTNVVMRRMAFNVGGASTVTVSHNFGTRDVQVSVYTNGTPWDDVICDITRPNANDVTLGFATAPPAGAYRAVVVG